MTMPLEQTINTEPLLTIMGIVAAAWAIIPRTRLLQISLNLSWIDWALTGFALLLANYLTFEPLLSSFNLYYSIGPWLPGLDSASATYLIFIVWLAYAFLRSRFGHLPRSNTKKFKELIDRLIATRQYDELELIIEPQLDKISEIAGLKNLQTNAFSKNSGLKVNAPNNHQNQQNIQTHQAIAHEIIFKIISTKQFASHISLTNPRICLKLIKSPKVIPTDFSTRFIEAIIKNTESQLHMELQNNKEFNTPGKGRRLRVNGNNIIIKELLSNPYIATNHYGVEAAISRTALQLIENNEILTNKLNTQSVYSKEIDKELNPINASISMLNILIHEGIHNQYQNSRGIRLMLYLTESLINQTEDGLNYNSRTGTPIRCLIEQIIATVIEWIMEGSYIEKLQKENILENIKNYDEALNAMKLQKTPEGFISNYSEQLSQKEIDDIFISRESAELLGEITGTIVFSKTMSDEWKGLCLNQIIQNYKETHKNPYPDDEEIAAKEKEMADLMLDKIIQGRSTSPEYRYLLRIHVERLDKEDSKPLRDRLLKAIAKDEARESSQ